MKYPSFISGPLQEYLCQLDAGVEDGTLSEAAQERLELLTQDCFEVQWVYRRLEDEEKEVACQFLFAVIVLAHTDQNEFSRFKDQSQERVEFILNLHHQIGEFASKLTQSIEEYLHIEELHYPFLEDLPEGLPEPLPSAISEEDCSYYGTLVNSMNMLHELRAVLQRHPPSLFDPSAYRAVASRNKSHPQRVIRYLCATLEQLDIKLKCNRFALLAEVVNVLLMLPENKKLKEHQVRVAWDRTQKN